MHCAGASQAAPTQDASPDGEYPSEHTNAQVWAEAVPAQERAVVFKCAITGSDAQGNPVHPIEGGESAMPCQLPATHVALPVAW